MTRVRPPERRRSWRQKARIHNEQGGSHTFYLEVGTYEDGRPCEIWIDAAKCGSFTRGVLDTLARVISLALQNGTPVGDLICTLRGLNYPPFGRVEASGTNVSSCTSVSDWIAQELEEALEPYKLVNGG